MRTQAAADARYRFPVREGNRFRLLADSDVFFPRMLETIAAARRYILLEMYLVASGSIMDRFIEALTAAASRGVRVSLLLDGYGSQRLTAGDRDRLAAAGVEVVFYNPLASDSILGNALRILMLDSVSVLNRNHRKLLLVDGRTAFTGGAGITDEVDAPGDPARRWRETMLEISGPVLSDWQRLFSESRAACTETPLNLPSVAAPHEAHGQTGRVTVNEARRRTGVQRSLLRHIKGSRRQVWFATAYFIPSWNLRRKLKQAAGRGIDVRLLLPGPVTDHPGARYASRRYYTRLLHSGVRIFEYQPRFFHAKTVLCDDWVSIGSCNHDRWNLHWNLEANQEVDDSTLAGQVARQFEQDFSHCRELLGSVWELRGWRERSLEWFWRQVERLSLRLSQRRRH